MTITTFARLEVSDVFRDSQNSQTLVRLNSKPGFESLEIGEKIALIFALESAEGGTDVKTYAENNAITAEFFHERHSCFCAGNDEFCTYLNPPPTKCLTIFLQIF